MTDTHDRLTAALADRYTIEHELGAGGMATVYLAHDVKHDRDVAIKVLRPDVTESLARERFLREIRLAARLTHPHILPLYDSGDANGLLFFVMPVMQGQTLRERMALEGPLQVEVAVRIAEEVADALDYAHRHDVVHRDIKPENVLLHEGHALVSDFGIGKAIVASGAAYTPTLTQIGVTVGTPAYMSPEQAAGESVDGRSDLFSLGCMLYEMLTGEQPFTGPTVQAVVARRFIHTPSPVAQARPLVPLPISHTVERLMDKDPANRYASGEQVVTALRKQDVVSAPTQPANEKSVAVLPFASMGPGAEDAYFADGITEEIINVLAQLKGLRVAARTSCFAFKERNENLRTVGEKLNVATILEGSVRKSGNRLRITAQLITAADGYHLWSERYDRELVDVFALQDDIANSIAAKLRLSLLDGSDRGESRAGPRNTEAYELLLRGRGLLRQRGPAIFDAIACLERAVDLDPEMADGHSALSDAYRLVWIYGMARARDMVPRARTAAERALSLDEENAQALASLSNITISHDLNVDGCLLIADRILARTPLHIQTLVERSLVIALRSDSPPQRSAQALHHLRAARRADPLNAWAAALESLSLSSVGLHDDAAREASAAMALDPQSFTARWAQVWALSALGRDDEALSAAMETLPMSGRNPRILAEMAAIHSRRGDAVATEAILDELHGRAATEFIEQSALGAVAAAAGHMVESRALIASAISEREVYWQFNKSPAWAAFLADPDGAAMLRETGF